MNGSGRASLNLRVFLAIIVTVGVLRYAQDVFIPLALAILLTFLLAPVVERLQRLHMNRGVAVVISVTIAIALLGGLVYVVFDQFTDLVNDLPRYRRQLRANLRELSGMLHGGMSDTSQAVEQLTRELERVSPEKEAGAGVPQVQVVEPPRSPLSALAQVAAPLVGPIATAAVVLVFVIFMLLRLPDLRDRLIRLLGSEHLRTTTEAMDDAARRVSRYLLMQTIINAWQGMWVAIGLSLLGLPNAILWGALTVVLRFIPYVGPWLAAAMPVALSFAVFDSWVQPLLTVGLFVVLELFSNMVLEPWLYGSRTGVSPIALLVAATFWTWLWGPVGLFMAVPLTVCLVVIGKYIPQLSFLYVLLGDQPVLSPDERLYQRLLATNRDEADDLLEDALRTESKVAVCDTVLIPAMQRAETDHDAGVLSDSKRAWVMSHIRHWCEDFAEVPSAEEGEEAHAEQEQPEGKPAPAPAPAPSAGATVLCVPAADPADEVAANLLASVLVSRAVEASVASVPLAPEPVPDAVVVSALPPDAVTAARSVCRHVRLRWPNVPIIVGLWNASGELERPRARLQSAGATRVVTSFEECLKELDAAIARGHSAVPSVATAIPL